MASSEIIMVRPCAFGFNEETAASNHFQAKHKTTESAQIKALEEFDAMVSLLKNEGIEVIVFQDELEPHTPDSIFPNNWFATHRDGTIVLFPMEAENRRLERRDDVINYLETSYRCQRIVDLSDAENIGVYLEGTGSIVFDHENRLAFACRSTRTDERLLNDYCETIDYQPVVFDALDSKGKKIYHTNVLMNVGKDYIVICLDAILPEERESVHRIMETTSKKLVEISHDQMNKFAGNMLELRGKSGLITVLSQSAFDVLSEEQKKRIASTSKLLPVPIPTIEQVGGGSVRCMMAEIFLPRI